MTIKETAKIINTLMLVYEKAFPRVTTASQKDVMIETWHSILSKYSFEKVEKNLFRYIELNKYPPTIADLVYSERATVKKEERIF